MLKDKQDRLQDEEDRLQDEQDRLEEEQDSLEDECKYFQLKIFYVGSLALPVIQWAVSET